MKRTLILCIVLLAFCISLVACGGLSQDDVDNAVNQATAPLNEKITKLEADIAEKQAKVTALEGEKTALTTEKTKLESEKKALSDQIAELEASIAAKNDEVATLNSAISALEAEKATLTAKITELEASIAEKDTEIATLNSSITALTAEKQALAEQVAGLEAENEALRNCLKGVHDYSYTSNGDGTHNKVCAVCSDTVTEPHTFDTDNACACYASGVQATQMTPTELKTALEELLALGQTNITINLAPDADSDIYIRPGAMDTMQNAIRTALSNSTVADGSVDLTINGLKTVASGFLGTVNYGNVSPEEGAAVTKVRTITLTDATSIRFSAFMDCTSLVSVFAPCVNNIELEAFSGCTSLETLSLTSEESITLGESNSAPVVFGDPSVSEQVKLILNRNKQAQVTENVFAGYTFGEVAYACADGTTAHSLSDAVAYVWNEDYTVCLAGYACSTCGYVDVVETVNATIEAMPENHYSAHTAAFENTAFETQTKQLGYVYDSQTNTYSVWSEEGLFIWRLAVVKDKTTNLTLMDDITLSTEGITVDENGKPSASNWTYVERFEGTLDGNGHSIINLRIYDKTDAYFIWHSQGSTIKNLTFVNPVVYGETPYTATLVSQITFGTSLINCHVQGGSVTAEKNGVGGLVGAVSYSSNYIYGCTNSAKVTGNNWVGGIIGSINDTGNVFVACANTGEISGNSQVGGIVGSVKSSDKLIGCYTTGGIISGNTDATVTGCYYVADSETDSMSGTTAVANEAALNSNQVADAMNASINSFNSTSSKACNYKWSVGDDGYLVPVTIE